MRIAVSVFKINNLALIFSPSKPRLCAAPNSPGIGHDAKAIIANNERGRQIEIINVFDGLMKNACFRGHVPAKQKYPAFFALILQSPSCTGRRPHEASNDPRTKHFVFWKTQGYAFAVDNRLL